MNAASAQTYDVVIIGGGLAGAAAAVRLAGDGAKTLLLEKEDNPHHKVCGEFISYEAQHYLEKLGVDLAECGAVPIDQLMLKRGQASVSVPLDFQAASVSRYRLDQAVLKQAEAKGAHVCRGITVTGIEQEASVWTIACQDKTPVRTKTIFLATGKHDLRSWSQRVGEQNDYIGFKMHFILSSGQYRALSRTVLIALYQGGYAGLEPIEDGKANLCLVVTKNQFAAWSKNWDVVLKNLMLATPPLAAYLAGATPCWNKPLAIFGIPYGFVYQAAANAPDALFRLGDQMAVIPSLCGDGMAIALHTAFLAADCYATSDARRYHHYAYAQLRPQITHAVRIARLVSWPILQPLILPLSRLLPSLVSQGVTITRLRQMVAS